MNAPEVALPSTFAANAFSCFHLEFRRRVVSAMERQFPNYPLPPEVRDILREANEMAEAIHALPELTPVAAVLAHLAGIGANHPRVFKQVLLLYRRHRAAWTEQLTEKTFHLALASTLEEEVRALDAVAQDGSFKQIAPLRLPRLEDYLPVQYIEATATVAALLPRQYDEKFHILQAPSLFLPDLTHFRARCEDRGVPLAIAFLDIDGFKQFNTHYGDTRVDRNLLPRFMQAMEAHVFHHGYAYRQGGDEYLLLLPSVSRSLAINFLEELRHKLARLAYPDIDEHTTVSVGMCMIDPDCPLTDRELRDRAVRAKEFAKHNGKNCVATFDGPDFAVEGLRLVTPPSQ